METRFLPLRRIWKTLKMSTTELNSRFTHVGQIPQHSVRTEFEEVQIPVPWGHISGKWYGTKNNRPIIGLHGWQDNAGTFDMLAPHLPSHVGFLAIDLPGHGLSSRIPNGMYYNSVDNITVLRMIMKEYNWDKISMIAHSMGSIAAFTFASLFPDKTELVVGLDALKPHVRPTKKLPESIASRMESFMIADERNRDQSEPPSYTYEECVERLYKGTFLSVTKENCEHLLARNIKKSSKYPDKYYFTRDSRLKYYNYTLFSQEVSLEMATRITAPYLFIKADGSSYFEEKKYFDEVLEVMKKNPKFEFYEVEGTHHVHLNEPIKISEIINPFICKYHLKSAEGEQKIEDVASKL